MDKLKTFATQIIESLRIYFIMIQKIKQCFDEHIELLVRTPFLKIYLNFILFLFIHPFLLFFLFLFFLVRRIFILWKQIFVIIYKAIIFFILVLIFGYFLYFFFYPGSCLFLLVLFALLPILIRTLNWSQNFLGKIVFNIADCSLSY